MNRTDRSVRRRLGKDVDAVFFEAVAINQIKALLVTAPAALRARLGNLTRRPLIDDLTQAVCPGLRQTYGVGIDSAATLLTAAGDNPERFGTMQGSRLSVESVLYQPARGRRIGTA